MIGSVLNNALSGLQVSQTALNVIANNVSNANTAGYVRSEVTLTSRPFGGVEVEAITRAANRYLAASAWAATADAGAAEVRSDLLSRAQLAFGDPSADSSIFSDLNAAIGSFQNLAATPASALDRSEVLIALETLFTEVNSLAKTVEGLRVEADDSIADAVVTADGLLRHIGQLNVQAAITFTSSSDSSGAETARDQAIQKLAEFVDLRVLTSDRGRVEVRTISGALLVGQDPSTLTYVSGGRSAYGEGGRIVMNQGSSEESQFDPTLASGKLKGLVQARDVDLPAISEALGEFAGVLADALNRVHAANTASPARTDFTGRQTGLLASDAIGFTGQSVFALTNPDGTLLNRYTIDFTGGTITRENPAATLPFSGSTIGSLRDDLNALLAADGVTAGFAGGRFTLTGGAGIAFGDAPQDTSSRGGRTFAQFFGFNELIVSNSPAFFEVGAAGTDAHGINAGGELNLRVRDSQGRIVAEPVIVPGGATWNDLAAQITGALGSYGTSAFAGGRLALTGNPGFTISIAADSTRRGDSGVSVSALFGLTRSATAGRATALEVNPALRSNPAYLAAGRPDFSAPVAIGDRIVEAGDSRGAQRLAQIGSSTQNFQSAGMMSGGSFTIATYASALGARTASMANVAESRANAATIVFQTAEERRAQVEGVNVDNELVKMTQYQQSYAAAARLIEAAREMFDLLLNVA